MFAIRFPPKAGRVQITFFVSGSMAKLVQSAVRPVSSRQLIRGAMSRPLAVAPMRTVAGIISSIRAYAAFT